MIFYTVGAEFAAGAKVATNFIYAKDDPAYAYMGNLPHPKNIEHGLGARFAMILKATPITVALPYASNEYIYDNVMDILDKPHNEEIFLFVLWAPFDRITKNIDNNNYMWSADTTISDVPTFLQKTYNKWKKSFVLEDAERYWHEKIWKLKKELESKNIKYVFGMESTTFTTITRKHRWGNKFIDPYNDSLYSICSQFEDPVQGFFKETAIAKYVNVAMAPIIKQLT